MMGMEEVEIASTGMEDESTGTEEDAGTKLELAICEIPLPVGTIVWLQ